jgi:hypothetical protein
MTRQETIERLRLWAARAQHETLEADTRANMLHWQAQAQVLSGVAQFLDSQDPTTPDGVIYRHVVADRTRRLAEWMAREGGDEAAAYSGAVAGFDVALTALRNMAGEVWPKLEQHVG